MAGQALYLFLGNTFAVQVRNDVESDPVGTIILYPCLFTDPFEIIIESVKPDGVLSPFEGKSQGVSG